MHKVLRYLTLAIVLVSADKNLMMIEHADDLWLSKENFVALTKMSFDSFVCSNIFISGTSEAVEILLDVFLRTYPFEYLMNTMEYACTGYLMIFSTPDNLTKIMESVPTHISDTQILIVIDAEVEKSSNLFNVSMYDNANLNIAAKNGFWTLSENHLVPRTFKTLDKDGPGVSQNRILNFRGRRLQVATDFNSPLSYFNKTIIRKVDGIDRELFVATKGHPEFDGIEVKLFAMIADRLNFTYDIRNRNGDYRYGRLNASGWQGGILGQVISKEVDIAFGGIWLELPQFALTNLTVPWSQLDVRFLVPRPKPYISFWVLTRPLSLEVWIGVLVMVVTKSVYVYTRSWINPRVQKRYRSFTLTWSELMAQLLGLTVCAKWKGFRLQFQLWNMIGVHIVTAYSSSLAARLASSDYEKRIDTAQDFIEANLTWGREGLAPRFSVFRHEAHSWKGQYLKHFESEANEAERHEKIWKGNYAILGRIVGSIFFPENEVRDGDLKLTRYEGLYQRANPKRLWHRVGGATTPFPACGLGNTNPLNYRLMKQPVGKYFVSFAVQPWLLNPCNAVLTWLRETGFVDYHLRDVIGRRTSAVYREILVEYDGLATEPRVLGLRPLAAAFSVLVVGLLISTIVFYYEITSRDKRMSKKNNLIKTKKRKKNANKKTKISISTFIERLEFK